MKLPEYQWRSKWAQENRLHWKAGEREDEAYQGVREEGREEVPVEEAVFFGGKKTSLVRVLTIEGTCFLPEYAAVEANDSNSKATS